MCWDQLGLENDRPSTNNLEGRPTLLGNSYNSADMSTKSTEPPGPGENMPSLLADQLSATSHRPGHSTHLSAPGNPVTPIPIPVPTAEPEPVPPALLSLPSLTLPSLLSLLTLPPGVPGTLLDRGGVARPPTEAAADADGMVRDWDMAGDPGRGASNESTRSLTSRRDVVSGAA